MQPNKIIILAQAAVFTQIIEMQYFFNMFKFLHLFLCNLPSLYTQYTVRHDIQTPKKKNSDFIPQLFL